jgi:YegS/Rv2252/BmrU family lipid kinase
LSKKILFIINPNSGHKNGADVIELIPKYLDENKFKYSYSLTTHQKHAIKIAAKAAKENIDIVVAVGGDGLVNEVFQSLVNTNVLFSIIPKGSGNGIARSLGIDMNIKTALKNINNLKTKKIDTVTFNGLPYLGIAGIGFDGFIAKEFSERNKRGLMSYIKVILKHYKDFKCSKYTIRCNNELHELDAFIVAIANTQQYGNNAYIAPKANITDGILDLVIIKKDSKWLLPIFLFKGFNKKLHKSRYVEYIKSKKFVIKTNYKQAHLDGEPINSKKENIIEVLPLSLNIFN